MCRPRRATRLALACLCLSAPQARAGGGLGIAWHNRGPSGSVTKRFACDTNDGGPFSLVLAVRPRAATEIAFPITPESRQVIYTGAKHFVMWQDAIPCPFIGSPAVPSSWGRLKSLYR